MCVEAYVAGGHLDPSNPYSDTLRNASARATTTELLVAESHGALVGTVTICPADSPWAEICQPGELEFRFLAVDPEHWRQGIGEALVEACEQRARDSDATAMVICVIESNEAAHRLYRRLGFVRKPGRDWIPVPGVRLLAYRRSVPHGS